MPIICLDTHQNSEYMSAYVPRFMDHKKKSGRNLLRVTSFSPAEFRRGTVSPKPS